MCIRDSVYATPMDNLTTASSIAAVEIKALTPYDNAHPAGSSLKDLVRIKYQSFDHVFDQTLKPTTFGSAYPVSYTHLKIMLLGNRCGRRRT